MTLNKLKKISTGTPFEFGEHRFHFGEEIVELADSTPLLNNLGALHRQMRRDGYLFIRGFHSREHAEQAARWTLQAIAQSGGLKSDTPIEEGIIGEANQTFSFFRQTEVAHAKPILDVVDSQRTMQFYEEFLGGSVITFDKRTRYQLAREEKDDRFFFREDGSWLGNFYNKGASYKPIAELRREWGLE